MKKLQTLTFLVDSIDLNPACFEILKGHTATPADICKLIGLQVVVSLVSLQLLETSIVVPRQAVPKLSFSVQVKRVKGRFGELE